MTPREIIAHVLEPAIWLPTARLSRFHARMQHQTLVVADAILSALTAAGYRLLGPGELDAETVERCAKVAARHNGFSPRDSRDIAAAIRALSQEAKP